MPKNKERFSKDQCQSCGNLVSEDDGLICDSCRNDFHSQRISWQLWLEMEQENSTQENN